MLIYDTPHYRPQNTYISNHQFIDYELPLAPVIYGNLLAIDMVEYANSVHHRFTPNSAQVTLNGEGKVILRNLTISEVYSSDFPIIRIIGFKQVELDSININNYNQSASLSYPLIQLSNPWDAFTLIKGLSIQNSYLYLSPLLKTLTPLKKVHLEN